MIIAGTVHTDSGNRATVAKVGNNYLHAVIIAFPIKVVRMPVDTEIKGNMPAQDAARKFLNIAKTRGINDNARAILEEALK